MRTVSLPTGKGNSKQGLVLIPETKEFLGRLVMMYTETILIDFLCDIMWIWGFQSLSKPMEKPGAQNHMSPARLSSSRLSTWSVWKGNWFMLKLVSKMSPTQSMPVTQSNNANLIKFSNFNIPPGRKGEEFWLCGSLSCAICAHATNPERGWGPLNQSSFEVYCFSMSSGHSKSKTVIVP